MKTGIVKFYNMAQGYGFITEDLSKRDYFWHVSSQLDPEDLLNTGTRVQFDIGENRRGECAINVQRY